MKIKIVKNGPYIVSGGVPLYQQVIVTDEAGHTKDLMDEKQYPVKETYTLCRCGESKDKPYCDGTHVALVSMELKLPAENPTWRRQKYLKGPS